MLKLNPILIGVTLATAPASAKVFDFNNPPSSVLSDGDNLSLECKNGNVTDSESLDVDAATITISVGRGASPLVRPITSFHMGWREVRDRFGSISREVFVRGAGWSGGALTLIDDRVDFAGRYVPGRYMSQHDGGWWRCANY